MHCCNRLFHVIVVPFFNNNTRYCEFLLIYKKNTRLESEGHRQDKKRKEKTKKTRQLDWDINADNHSTQKRHTRPIGLGHRHGTTPINNNS